MNRKSNWMILVLVGFCAAGTVMLVSSERVEAGPGIGCSHGFYVELDGYGGTCAGAAADARNRVDDYIAIDCLDGECGNHATFTEECRALSVQSPGRTYAVTAYAYYQCVTPEPREPPEID